MLYKLFYHFHCSSQHFFHNNKLFFCFCLLLAAMTLAFLHMSLQGSVGGSGFFNTLACFYMFISGASGSPGVQTRGLCAWRNQLHLTVSWNLPGMRRWGVLLVYIELFHIAQGMCTYSGGCLLCEKNISVCQLSGVSSGLFIRKTCFKWLHSVCSTHVQYRVLLVKELQDVL